jgi:hypothetical protein
VSFPGYERRRGLILRPPESLDRRGWIRDIDRRRCIRRWTIMTSANPDPRQLLTTLMEENPDATEQELFQLLVDAVKDEPDVRDAIIREAIIREYVWRSTAH